MAIKKKIVKQKSTKKVVKKAVAKKSKNPPASASGGLRRAKKEILLGEVVHYFDHIKVAVIKLKTPLSVGGNIRIVGGQDTDFKQKVQSMEVEHKKISQAKKGQEVGIKVKDKVRDGYKVFKVD
jgi:putative protease